MVLGSQPEESTALRKYYADESLLLSKEWVLKVLAIDITISTVMGVLLLVTAIVNAVLCDTNTVFAYFLMCFGMLSSAVALSGAVATYRAATRRLDRALPAREPRGPRPTEQEV
ncbi:hypothetical protein evm_002427 [Chilo suppressalis]|nr:hypothetical protein evm_002427 [Chilo suppressalis]